MFHSPLSWWNTMMPKQIRKRQRKESNSKIIIIIKVIIKIKARIRSIYS